MAVIVASMVRLIITAVSYFAMLLQSYDSSAITCSKRIDAKQVFTRAALAEYFAVTQAKVSLVPAGLKHSCLQKLIHLSCLNL